MSVTNIATTLHTLLCNEDHQKKCLWYLEAQQAECWELKAHAKWINKAEGIKLLDPTKSEEQIENLLKELIQVINSIKRLQWQFSELEDFIKVVLEKTCLKTA